MGRENEELRIFVQRANGVTRWASKALWPTTVRRVIATGKAAQRRRSMIIGGRWWMKCPKTSTIVFLCLFVLCVMISGVALIMALVWQFWYLLCVPAGLLLILLLVVTRRIMRAPSLARPPCTLHAMPHIPPYQLRSFPGLSSLRGSPETPMPEGPALIRVLETFDLSRTDVEHFLGISSKDTAELPLAWYGPHRAEEGLTLSRLDAAEGTHEAEQAQGPYDADER